MKIYRSWKNLLYLIALILVASENSTGFSRQRGEFEMLLTIYFLHLLYCSCLFCLYALYKFCVFSTWYCFCTPTIIILEHSNQPGKWRNFEIRNIPRPVWKSNPSFTAYWCRAFYTRLIYNTAEIQPKALTNLWSYILRTFPQVIEKRSL